MADTEKYMIKVNGKLVEVTLEVYYAYFRMERQERGQEEKKAYNQVMSYDALDDEEKKAIIEAKRIAEEEEERKRQELEERKNTPGYCRICGAPDAEYIPFEEMYMCKDCYYDFKY